MESIKSRLDAIEAQLRPAQYDQSLTKLLEGLIENGAKSPSSVYLPQLTLEEFKEFCESMKRCGTGSEKIRLFSIAHFGVSLEELKQIAAPVEVILEA